MDGKLLIYTREAIPDHYCDELAASIHFAYSDDGLNYRALNQNYGILFAQATIDSNDVIQPKSLKKPYIFRTKEGDFGIAAIRINADGSKDAESKGQILLWTSKDLITFAEQRTVTLKDGVYVEKVVCEYDGENGHYQINWRDEGGNCYKNILTSLSDTVTTACKVSTKCSCSCNGDLKGLNLPEGAIVGNTVSISSELGKKLLTEWLPLENIAVKVPDTIRVGSLAELQSIQARAIYSDGSEALKQVEWDTKDIDFTKPGTYEISGTVWQEKYPFPLAIGYADPVVIEWEGKYYFMATNDNVNNIGIFVREADTVPEFFEEDVEEYLILDKDEARGLIQTFWAPEFHVVNGELYIFFAVGGEQWGPQCHVMKLKEGGKVTDPNSWTDPVRVLKKDGSNLTDDGITLDMTYFEVEETSYVVWSYRRHIGSPADTGSMLYIATVDRNKPWQLTSDPILLSRPLYGWENLEGTINNEGAFPLLVDDLVYIAFSGGAATGYSYAIGFLIAKKGQDLLDINNWYKTPTPALSFYSVEGEYGPGHNAFFTHASGDVILTYHAEPTRTGSKRCTAMRRVHFDSNNRPRLDMSEERDLKDKFKQQKMKIIIDKIAE